MQYEVQVNGKTVWTGESDGEFDKNVFPQDYRTRPEKGSSDEITLLTDGNIISVNRAEDAPTPEAEIVGAGGSTAADAEGAGG